MNIKREKLGHKGSTFGAFSVLFIMLLPLSMPIAKIYGYLMAVPGPGPLYVLWALDMLFIYIRYVNKENKYIERFKSSPYNKISDYILWIGIGIPFFVGIVLLSICLRVLNTYFEYGNLRMWLDNLFA